MIIGRAVRSAITWVGCLGQTPVLSGNERPLRLEQVLPVVHVEHWIAGRDAVLIVGREIDGDLSLVPKNVGVKAVDVLERAAARFLSPVLQTEHALKRRAQRVAHLPHQLRISR